VSYRECWLRAESDVQQPELDDAVHGPACFLGVGLVEYMVAEVRLDPVSFCGEFPSSVEVFGGCHVADVRMRTAGMVDTRARMSSAMPWYQLSLRSMIQHWLSVAESSNSAYAAPLSRSRAAIFSVSSAVTAGPPSRSGCRRRDGDGLVYAAAVDDQEAPLQRFAVAVKTARLQRGWTQEDLNEASGVSRPTIQRYENAKVGQPHPLQCRMLFEALGLDVRRIPVLFGYVTAEEMSLPPKPPRVLRPAVEEMVRLIDEGGVSDQIVGEWVSYLRWRLENARKAAGPTDDGRAP
jgi:transcriptional regulator with XRE-family HTH domain